MHTASEAMTLHHLGSPFEAEGRLGPGLPWLQVAPVRGGHRPKGMSPRPPNREEEQGSVVVKKAMMKSQLGWKMMDFVSWDDDIPKISGNIWVNYHNSLTSLTC
jgi:hypothetical protein